MRKISISAIVVLLISTVLIGCSSISKYTNRDAGFSIEYPRGSELEEDEDSITIQPSEGIGYLSVHWIGAGVPSPLTADEYSDYLIESLISGMEGEDVSRRTIDVADVECPRVDMTGFELLVPIRSADVILATEEQTIFLSWSTKPTEFEAFEESFVAPIVASFRLLE